MKAILKPAIALFVICLVAAALLAATNSVTHDKIEEIAAQTENEARFSLFPDAASFGDPQQSGDVTYAAALDYRERVIGYTFTTAAKGYGGDVTVMTGVLPDGTVGGVEILDVSDETPGLGQNAKKPEFKAQFAGMSGKIGVSTASKQAANGIDALTGATYTSKGVAEAVNMALQTYQTITKGGAQLG